MWEKNVLFGYFWAGIWKNYLNLSYLKLLSSNWSNCEISWNNANG